MDTPNTDKDALRHSGNSSKRTRDESPSGVKKPFYEDILNKRRRPGKSGASGRSGPRDSRPDSRGGPSRDSRPDSRGGPSRDSRPDSRGGPSRDSRPDSRGGPSRDSRPDSRGGPSRDSRPDSRGGPSRDSRPDSRGGPSRDSRPDSRGGPSRDSRPDSRGGPSRDSRPDSRGGPSRDSRPDSRGGPSRDSRPDSRGGPSRDSRPDSFPRPERFAGPFSPPTELEPVFGTLSAEAQRLLSQFLDLSLDVLPLDSKKLQLLPDDIRELSHDLTDDRSSRRWGYMNDPATLSAYIRYYQWWNLVRLTRLFAALPLTLEDDDSAVDLGSGPLTLPIALWISRPDLRAKKITWYCVDISSGALSAGEELFLRIAAETGEAPWTIVRVKGAMGVSLRKKAALVASANMFNEMFLDESGSVMEFAANQARDLASYAFEDASILVIEPGIPRTGNFISLIRRALMHEGFIPCSPCPHTERCPFPGERNKKWCHFVFDTADAPEPLKKLSAQATLSKDRAALSYVFAQGKKAVEKKEPVEDTVSEEAPIAEESVTPVSIETGVSPLGMLSRMSELFPPLRIRIVSDPIRLPNHRTGRYGCSDLGMVLVTGAGRAAQYLQDCQSGFFIELPRPNRKQLERDQKTGATLICLDGQPPRGDNSRGDNSRGDSSRGDSSRGDSFRGGNDRGDNSRGDSSRGDSFRGGNPRGGQNR